ncbi:ORF-99 [Agrotis segetum nucleopolyhedrovirus A]|uniref:ORF-99 n=1 Tax=Agrotis segetum nuclear polyhedrosis virus TaxID=1962501 RepID=Q287H3_NPVAS|nr:ORF-99 [Agrotis segetum nucleopolyhedrovirus A]AAZ38265.1 ORF-99 [Agrotis segetum nucleopolyhedrovirus A]
MNGRYRVTPKYKNTDVSASTVQNLLQTINNMSQRCKGQANTDDIVQRVRSIILMHRPHLATRIDLQLPELAMEAFMPNSSTGNQITHNFNYKYDYNTNMPQAFNPFLQQQQQQFQQPTVTPLQSFTFNATPTGGIVGTDTGTNNLATATAAVPSQTETRIVTAPLSIEPDDLNNLNVLYVNAQRMPSVASYKQLLRQIVFLVQKYVRYEQITISLELIETFDSLQTNDLGELLSCIERETRWSISPGSSVCRLISMLVTAYCRVVTLVTKREFAISAIKTEERLRTSVVEVEQAIVDLINTPPPQPPPVPMVVTPDPSVMQKEQIDSLTASLQERNDQLVRAQTSITTLQQQLDTAESRNLLLNNVFGRIQKFVTANVDTTSGGGGGGGVIDINNADDLVSRFINSYVHLQSQSTQNASVLSQQTNIYNQLEQKYVESEQKYIESESRIASMQLKLNSYEDVQSQLRAAQEKTQQLQQQLTAQVEKHNKLQIEYSALKKESRKPMHRVRAMPRRSEQQSKSARSRHVQKLIQNQETLIRERQQLNDNIKQLKEKHATTLENTDKTVRQLKLELQETRSRIETMASNQAALTPTDVKLLNTKSNQVLVDRVSKLIKENEAVKQMCDRELARESNELRDRLNDSKINLDSRIDKLMSQIQPLQARVEQTTADLNQLEVRYEKTAREASRTPSRIQQQ